MVLCLLQPANFGRILLLCGADILRAMASQINHKIKNTKPYIRKTFIYYLVRACANVYIREINTKTIVGDMIKEKTDIKNRYNIFHLLRV